MRKRKSKSRGGSSAPLHSRARKRPQEANFEMPLVPQGITCSKLFTMLILALLSPSKMGSGAGEARGKQ